MIYEPSEAAQFRQRLLTSPGERQDVDYKASIGYAGGESFSLKLIRHIQGMANTGGGWLIIGFSETDDQGLVPDLNHDNSITLDFPDRLK